MYDSSNKICANYSGCIPGIYGGYMYYITSSCSYI